MIWTAGRYRVIDRGPSGLCFERRAKDALGAEKWDDCALQRGSDIRLPYALVLEMLRVVMKPSGAGNGVRVPMNGGGVGSKRDSDANGAASPKAEPKSESDNRGDKLTAALQAERAKRETEKIKREKRLGLRN